MRRLGILLGLFALVGGAVQAQERIMVAAAANISSAAPELAKAFAKAYPAYRVDFVFGASGNLVTQLLNGSPSKVFLSADLGFAQKIADAGEAAGPVRTYAYGSLILLSTKRLDFGKGLGVLESSEVAKVAVANPETAPYGRAALQALGATGTLAAVQSKIVVAQNVTQALQYILTGADAGFVNKSVLRSPELKPYDEEGAHWIAVDPSLYSPVAQGFVVMKGAASDPAAKAFADFLLSPAAASVFSSFGYGVP